MNKLASKLNASTNLSKVGLIFGIVIAGFITTKVLQTCTQVKAFCTSQNSHPTQVSQIAPQYFNYDPAILDQSLSEQKRVVLYFHALWCTSCSYFEKEMLTPGEKLPSNVIVLKADFDSSSALKQQYGVIHQHTLVLLNPEGKVQEMWIGGDLTSLQEYLEKYL